MRNTKVKKMIMLIGIFLMAITFNISSYAASLIGTGNVDNTSGATVNAGSWKQTKFYDHPSWSDNSQLGQDGFWISKTVGFFCGWHGSTHSLISGWANKITANPCGDVVNNWRFIMSLGDGEQMAALKSGANWRQELVQQTFWYMESKCSGDKIYDAYKLLGVNEVSGNKPGDGKVQKYDGSFTKTVDFKRVLNANTYYINQYDKDNQVEDGKITKPKVTFADKQMNVYQNSSTGVTYFGKFKMNDYDTYYNEDCGYVNQIVDYSGYGSVSKYKKRAAILAGIVNARLTVQSGGETVILNWEDGDFKFAYGTIGEDTGKKTTAVENYTYFPGPKSEFYVKITDLKGLTLNGSVTATLRFDSIQVKSRTYTNEQAYIIHRQQLATKEGDLWGQPALNCGGWMKTRTTISKAKGKVSVNNPIAKINVYITDVEGGGKSNEGGEVSKYHYQNNGTNGNGALQVASGNTGNLFKVQDEGGRASWSESRKKLHRVVAELGDTITFNIVITNLASYAIIVDNVKLSGCVDVADRDGQHNVFINGGNTSYYSNIKMTNLVDKIPAGGEYTFTCKVKNVAKTRKWLKATLGTIRKASTGKVVSNKNSPKTSSVDYFKLKKYLVTVDKFISGTSDGVSKESSSGGFYEDDEDEEADKDEIIAEDVEDFDESGDGVETPDSDTGDILSSESGSENIINIMNITSATKRIWGQEYQVVQTSDEPIYYKSGVYYYYDASFGVAYSINVSGNSFTTNDINKTHITEYRCYLNWDGIKNEPIYSDSNTVLTNEGELYVIYDESGYNFGALYNGKTGEEAKYYVTDLSGDSSDGILKVKEIKLVYDYVDGGSYAYHEGNSMPGGVLEGTTEDSEDLDEDRIYVKVIDGAVKVDASTLVDNCMYTVEMVTTGSKQLYYHEGLKSYFVKSVDADGSTRYTYVTLHKTADTAYFTEADYDEDSDDRILLETDVRGEVVKTLVDFNSLSSAQKNALKSIDRLFGNKTENGVISVDYTKLLGNLYAVKDITGTEIVAYYHDVSGNFIYVDLTREVSTAVSIHPTGSETAENSKIPVYHLSQQEIEAGIKEAIDKKEEEDSETEEDDDAEVKGLGKARELATNETKKANPVQVEVGDTVEYSIVLYNTANGRNSWTIGEVNGRSKNPYYKPKGVFVNVEDALPKQYIETVSSITMKFTAYNLGGLTSKTYTKTVSVSGGQFKLEEVYVPDGGMTVITYSVKVSAEAAKENPAENKATITKVKNGNDADVSESDMLKTPAQRKTSSDYFYSKEEDPAQSEMGGLVYVAKVEHLEDYGTMADETLDEDSATTIVSGSPATKDTITTFEGRGNNVAAEYGDKITYGIKVTDHWEPKASGYSNYGATTINDFSRENPDYDHAKVTVRVDLPADALTVTHKGEACYMVWINEVLYYIPTYNKQYLMITYTTSGGTVKTVEDYKIERMNPYPQVVNKIWKGESRNYSYSYSNCSGGGSGSNSYTYSWCEDEKYDCPNNHQKKTVKEITSFDLEDDTLKVGILNNNESKDAQIPLSASITAIEYYHSYGYKWQWESTPCSGHYNFSHYEYSNSEHVTGYNIIDGVYYPISHYDTYLNGPVFNESYCTQTHQNCNDNSQVTNTFEREMKKEYNVEPYTGTPNYCKGHCSERIMLNGKFLGTAWCVITDYNVQVDEYIYEYNAEMLNYNNAHGFTRESKVHSPTTKYDTPTNALAVEKYETLKYQTKVTNLPREGYEAENNTGRWKSI